MINRVEYEADRLTWLYINGEFPSTIEEVVHKNGDLDDNS